ncbi:MAG: carbohydrate ABC transporter permease [Treponema sp.]|jgi:sn-glycerol 3-phosphate transport system permease protein|nr:carbohydrate ABC transporter permease [Treponema sp.]
MKSRRIDPFHTAAAVFMGVLGVLFLVPMIWTVRTAFVSPGEALNITALPVPTLKNFGRVWSAAPFGRYYANTVLMTAGILIVQFVSITMAGYAFARIDFYGSKVLFVLMLSQLMITPDVLIMPVYRLMGKLSLINTRTGIMLPFFASAMGTFFIRQTIKTIPYELEEAARVDGCPLPRMLLRIYVPLLKPAYIAFGFISASYQWNNFLWPLVMINSVEKRPLTLGLAIFAMSYETGAQWSDVCAATLLVSAPLLLAFFIFSKEFTESMAHAGIK